MRLSPWKGLTLMLLVAVAIVVTVAPGQMTAIARDLWGRLR